LEKGTIPQTSTSIYCIENAVEKTFFKSLTWAALKKLCPWGWVPGFWTLKHDLSFEELETSCNFSWKWSKSCMVWMMMENKNNEIWHWAPSNTYHMIASKQLSNITIHQ
jgi:hypothetical protein